MNLDHDTITAFADALRAKGKQPATVESYCRDARHFLDFLAQSRLPGDQVEPATLVAFQQHLTEIADDRENSIRRKIIGVRQFYRFLCEHKHIGSTPFDDVPIPERDDRLPDGLTDSQLNRMRACLEGQSLKERRDAAIVMLLGFEGLKATELIELRWEDVLLGDTEASLRVRGPRARVIALQTDTTESLRSYRDAVAPLKELVASEGHVFVAFKGKDAATVIPQLTRHGLKFMLYELGEKSGVGALNTELLRHFAVRFQLALGRSPETIMQHLGLRRPGNIAKHAATLPRERHDRRS